MNDVKRTDTWQAALYGPFVAAYIRGWKKIRDFMWSGENLAGKRK